MNIVNDPSTGTCRDVDDACRQPVAVEPDLLLPGEAAVAEGRDPPVGAGSRIGELAEHGGGLGGCRQRQQVRAGAFPRFVVLVDVRDAVIVARSLPSSCRLLARFWSIQSAGTVTARKLVSSTSRTPMAGSPVVAGQGPLPAPRSCCGAVDEVTWRTGTGTVVLGHGGR